MIILGFYSKQISWIKSYLKLNTISTLVNKSLRKDFTMKIGLRQGNPSSSLFHCCRGMEWVDDESY